MDSQKIREPTIDFTLAKQKKTKGTMKVASYQ